MFLFSRLRQRVHGGCDRSAEDSYMYSSVEPDPTSILFFNRSVFSQLLFGTFPSELDFEYRSFTHIYNFYEVGFKPNNIITST